MRIQDITRTEKAVRSGLRTLSFRFLLGSTDGRRSVAAGVARKRWFADMRWEMVEEVLEGIEMRKKSLIDRKKLPRRKSPPG
jgi:hypothetical protein